MRPNFLFIVADDLNAWIGALGRNPDVKTPNIDRLARRGASFVNAYCSAPYCNASRMGVFTGTLPSTTGIYHNEPLWNIAGRRPTFIELLRQSGYYTFGEPEKCSTAYLITLEQGVNAWAGPIGRKSKTGPSCGTFSSTMRKNLYPRAVLLTDCSILTILSPSHPCITISIGGRTRRV